MLFNKLIIGSLLVIPVLASANSITETQERLAIQQQVLTYMINEDWTKLDGIIQDYNNGFPTTSGGTHKLVIAWGGIENLFWEDVSGRSINDVASKWLKAIPNSSGARILQAMAFNVKAVGLRGEGATSTVDPNVWPTYKKLITQEKEFLLKNKDISDKDVTWYQKMELVARNLGDKELLYRILEEGSKKYPAYQNIYLEAMVASLPKWGGSVVEIEKVARMAASNNKNQTGLSYYSYIWNNAMYDEPELISLLKNSQVVSWEDMLQGWQDRYKQYPSTRTLNSILITSCIAHNKETFLKADKMVRGEIEPDIWPQGVEYRKCKRTFR
ncbi:DUF4034 domain-containing protein [Klebsiella aerogenes]|uniref:DUF4034 domain-containing protein n=1 Tax=Klebsiella aerogenes TaxID=548 RepID=UPI002DB65E53|nr:DUF4034 domain-containing protein [Klebsiella aerogenes]MEB5742670.1 DUF4034 domain-containing protein [Klebsiella aerogenes]